MRLMILVLPHTIIILIYDMLPLFFILFIILFFNLLRSGRPNSNMIFLLIWILVPFLVLSLQLNRQGRYIAPICPAFALFSGMGIEKIETKKLRTILIIFIIGFGLLEFFSNSYEVNILPKDAIKIGSDNISLFYYPEYNRPNVDDWKTEEIVATLLDYQIVIKSIQQLA